MKSTIEAGFKDCLSDLKVQNSQDWIILCLFALYWLLITNKQDQQAHQEQREAPWHNYLGFFE